MLKRLSFILLLLMLLPLVLAMPAQAQDADASVVRIGTIDMPTSLDPAMAETFMEWEILRHLYVGLTMQMPGTQDYELAVAESYSVSENGLIHTFVLRDDVSFIDGTPITAELFADSIQRVLALNEDGALIMRDVVDTVEASDSRTLVFELFQPTPYFDRLVSLPPFFALHPDDFPSARVNRDIETLRGNGVYILESWQSDNSIVLTPNPDYQFGEPARNGGIVLQNYTATEDLRQALINGAVDVAWRDVRLPQAVETADENAEIEIEVVPSIRQWYMYISTARQFSPPLDDIALREVILRTLSRETVTEDYFDGYLTPAHSLVPEFAGDAYSPIFESFESSEEAIDMLLDNGYSPNRPVNVFFATSRQAYGDYYASALSPLRLSLSPINRYVSFLVATNFVATEWVRNLQELGFMAPVFSWTPSVVHPDLYLRPLIHSENEIATSANYAQSEIDVLLNQARLAQDEAEQAELYRQVQELMRDSYTLIPLWQDELHALYRSEVSGVTIEANFFLRYDLLEK